MSHGSESSRYDHRAMADPNRSAHDGLSMRSRAAIAAGRTVAGASKLARLGTGSVVGGNVSLKLDPHLLGRLFEDRRVAIVSGTNGKTTTTALLSAALGVDGPVVSNSLGANMPPGIVAALGDAEPGAAAVVEVDERWLPAVLNQTGPATVVLLNLSRDQLDRSHEVRKIADTWRIAFDHLPHDFVVANADDPLVVWSASSVDPEHVTWVGTGGWWTLDASGCPSCSGRIEFGADGRSWRCLSCDFTRPQTNWSLDVDADLLVGEGKAAGITVPLGLDLPGRANAANAAMVLAAAHAMGTDPTTAIVPMRSVHSVAGRYRTAAIAGATVRMLLAKNPAGWQEAIDMVSPPPTPVVTAINARIADGRDPSWLWDVPYERLRDRFVVATGERRHDLAVRLRYADVEHAVADDLVGAVRLAVERTQHTEVDLIANYTAFQDYLDEVGRDD